MALDQQLGSAPDVDFADHPLTAFVAAPISALTSRCDMAVETRELYNSPNGDRWFLCRDPATGEAFVRHEPNPPSGGRPSDIAIGLFLSRGERNPEHHALLRLIGTLLDGDASEAPYRGS
jgi:hypothetical protein